MSECAFGTSEGFRSHWVSCDNPDCILYYDTKHSRSIDRRDRGFFALPTYRRTAVPAHLRVTQMKSQALVSVSWLWTVRVRILRIPVLENLTSFRFRLWLALIVS